MRNEAKQLIEIVEGIDGAMKHGTWRDDKGRRLKDTNEWVEFYNSAHNYGDNSPPIPKPNLIP